MYLRSPKDTLPYTCARVYAPRLPRASTGHLGECDLTPLPPTRTKFRAASPPNLSWIPAYNLLHEEWVFSPTTGSRFASAFLQ